MNLLSLFNNVALLKIGDEPSTWADIDMTDNTYLEILNAINLCLQDLWQNYDYIFKNRTTTMTCVIGQNNYDVPFDGKLLQDGLLLQPTDIGALKDVLHYDYNYENFFKSTLIGEPQRYHMFNNQLYLSPIPDKTYVLTCLYQSFNWALSVTTVDTQSLSGQKVLSVASTAEFLVGDIVYINKGTSTEETGVIDSIQTGVSLTLVGNLTFTHNINERVIVERQTMQYANDEPNFPKEYHNIIVYYALTRLFYYDAAKLAIYMQVYQSALMSMIANSKNSQDGTQRIIFTNTYWK